MPGAEVDEKCVTDYNIGMPQSLVGHRKCATKAKVLWAVRWAASRTEAGKCYLKCYLFLASPVICRTK